LFNKEIASFVEKRTIPKNVIKSYDDMETMLIIRERLIKLSNHHVSIFGELLSTSTTSDSFAFHFKYVPSVALKDLLLLDLNQNQSRYLVDQLWLFFGCLRSNGFESEITNLISKNNLKDFFDKLEYGFDGNIAIADFSFVLTERKTCEKLNKTQEQRLLKEI
jgi:hypothetical protein